MPLSIQLPRDIENRLARLVQVTGRGQAYCVIEALRQHLEEIEEAYLVASIAEQVQTGQMRTHSIEETKRALNL